MTQAETILFWFSFVGTVAFIVNGLYATLTLRQYKTNPMTTSETMITYMTTAMSVLFIVFSVQFILKPTPEPTEIINVPCDELYKEYGTIIQYNDITETNDTIILYTRTQEK